MFKINAKKLLLAGVLAAASAATAAQAAPPPFCANYADVAIRQVRDARDHPARCGALVASFPARWTLDRRAHFDWCRGVSRGEADSERRAREEGLRSCLG